MKDAKDITKKLNANMVAIFRVRSDACSSAPSPPPPSRVNPMKSTIPPGVVDGGDAVSLRKNKSRDKKRGNYDGSSGGAAKKNYKRKHESEYYRGIITPLIFQVCRAAH